MPSRFRLRPRARGITLIEVMIVMVLFALFVGTAVIGAGAVTSARVKSAANLIASGTRVAFSRSSSTSKSMRLVLDLDQDSIWLEESSMPMLVRRDDETQTGGAEGSTQQERDAIKEASRIIQGTQEKRPLFKPVQALGFETDGPGSGRKLPSGVHIRRVEVEHSADPITSGRAYLYFWPGGMTERASIQISKKDSTADEDTISVLVAPLTGNVKVVSGAKPMEKPREDSERDDKGY